MTAGQSNHLRTNPNSNHLHLTPIARAKDKEPLGGDFFLVVFGPRKSFSKYWAQVDSQDVYISQSNSP